MKKKKITNQVKKYLEYCSSLPEWYWKNGLHDAKVLSINVVKDYENNEISKEKFSSIEIQLDSKNAIYESDIETIVLYDCVVLETDIKFEEFNDYIVEYKLWWLGDDIKKLDNDYKLDIYFVGLNSAERKVSVCISSAKVIRK